MKKLKAVRVARIFTVPFSRYTLLRTQIEALQEAGAEVTVVSSPEDPNEAIDLEVSCNLYPVSIPREISLFSDLVTLYRLFKVFSQEKFDIVHSSTPKAGLLCAIAAKLARVPIRLHTYTGQTWVSLKGIKKKIVQSCDKLIGFLNTFSYVDSRSQLDFLIHHKVVNSDRIKVLGEGSFTGVDLARFNQANFSSIEKEKLREELQIEKEQLIILFVGRIKEDKGVMELMGAFKQVLSKIQNVALVMVGPFEENEDEIKSYARINCGKKIIFVGFNSKPENYMAIADVLCLPSYREGFGSVVIEAAAMGVPTVGTAIYGLQDAVCNEITGILVEPKNVSALSNALLKLIENKELRLKMGEEAKKRAIEKFDSRIIDQLLITEYQNLLNAQKIS